MRTKDLQAANSERIQMRLVEHCRLYGLKRLAPVLKVGCGEQWSGPFPSPNSSSNRMLYFNIYIPKTWIVFWRPRNNMCPLIGSPSDVLFGSHTKGHCCGSTRAEGSGAGEDPDNLCPRGDIIRPVHSESQTLTLQPTTLAELLRAAGHFVPVVVDASDREHELALEASIFDFDLRKFVVQRVEDHDCSWTFVVSDGIDAEEAFLASSNPADYTKMMLARRIAVQDGLSRAECFRLFSRMTKAALSGRLGSHC